MLVTLRTRACAMYIVSPLCGAETKIFFGVIPFFRKDLPEMAPAIGAVLPRGAVRSVIENMAIRLG